MKIAVLKETKPGERRVSLSPESVKKLRGKGPEVVVQAGAGASAGFFDKDYTDAGASIEASVDALLGAADLVVKINAPTPDEIAKTKPGAGLKDLLNMLRHALAAYQAQHGVQFIDVSAGADPRCILRHCLPPIRPVDPSSPDLV